MKKSFTVHDLPISERPRERLLKHGVAVLSQQELLALILGRGTKGESVMVTAQTLLSEFRTIKKLATASVEELTKIKGIGTAKATQIKAALELSQRMDNLDDPGPKIAVKSPDDVMKVVKNQLKGKKKEHFYVLLLDTRNHLIELDEVSKGSLDSSVVHPREVFQKAILHSAASVIFVHNHPSGDPTPSKDDIQLTKRLIEVGELMGIEVLDHIIACDYDHLSMKAKNFL
jgi:DNA repair protein RadC